LKVILEYLCRKCGRKTLLEEVTDERNPDALARWAKEHERCSTHRCKDRIYGMMEFVLCEVLDG